MSNTSAALQSLRQAESQWLIPVLYRWSSVQTAQLLIVSSAINRRENRLGSDSQPVSDRTNWATAAASELFLYCRSDVSMSLSITSNNMVHGQFIGISFFKWVHSSCIASVFSWSLIGGASCLCQCWCSLSVWVFHGFSDRFWLSVYWHIVVVPFYSSTFWEIIRFLVKNEMRWYHCMVNVKLKPAGNERISLSLLARKFIVPKCQTILLSLP